VLIAYITVAPMLAPIAAASMTPVGVPVSVPQRSVQRRQAGTTMLLAAIIRTRPATRETSRSQQRSVSSPWSSTPAFSLAPLRAGPLFWTNADDQIYSAMASRSLMTKPVQRQHDTAQVFTSIALHVSAFGP